MRAIAKMLRTRLDAVRSTREGRVADYIPALAAVDPERCAVAIGGAQDRVVAVGDDDAEFTIQSISKPFVLAHAFEVFGREQVLRAVGVEPNGEPFNTMSLDPETGRPANPMQNAGAIATVGLLQRALGPEAVLAGLSRFAGRALEVDEEVCASESETGSRNLAMGHLLRSHGILGGDVETTVATYFRQCATRVTIHDVATMATTLAFGGRHPLTGARVVSEQVARDVLAVMASCGMYDYSGEWMLRVGMPAKSGVSGAVMAISPSQFGVAAFSPRLDRHGNSVRAVELLELLSRDLGMHMFEQHPSIAEPDLRIRATARMTVLDVSGELPFSAVGRVLRVIGGALENGASVVVQLHPPLRAHPSVIEALEAQVELSEGRVRLVHDLARG